MSENKLSILIGSGFSIPDGKPSVNEINKRLSKIEVKEISIYNGDKIRFLNGAKSSNDWDGLQDKIFIQEFLKFYNSEILDGKEFDYEIFYDYISSYFYDGNDEVKNKIKEFYSKLCDEHSLDKNISCSTSLMRFRNNFNQLVASMLVDLKYLSDITISSYRKYDDFLYFIKKFSEKGSVKIHSLNHDLLLDHILNHHVDFYKNFSDGFELEGSPFFGELEKIFKDSSVIKSYNVKLKYWTNNFDKPISLIKLHGSIDNIAVYNVKDSTNQKKVIKNQYGVSNYKIEIKDENTGEYKFVNLFDDAKREFLSGKTHKILYYDKDPFYIDLFNQFRTNLEEADQLIIIGYGFQDKGVNEYLKKYYLSKGKKILIIDIKKPETDLLIEGNHKLIQKSIIDVSREELIKFLNE